MNGWQGCAHSHIVQRDFVQPYTGCSRVGRDTDSESSGSKELTELEKSSLVVAGKHESVVTREPTELETRDFTGCSREAL